MPKYGRNLFIELSLREALEEIASGVFEYTWLNDEHAVDICLYYFHNELIIRKLIKLRKFLIGDYLLIIGDVYIVIPITWKC